MSVYQLKVTVLSPLHIGNGGELRRDFDFVAREKNTYRFNEDAILEAKYDTLMTTRAGQYPPPGKLLTEADFQNPNFFRYVLRGVPRSTKTDAILKTCIKDVYDRPYIPGSSLKGAFRTALAVTGWGEVTPPLTVNRYDMGRNRSWAGQGLERKIFGPDPNHSLMRALQVGDCHTSLSATDSLIIVNAQVLTLRAAGSPIEMEAVSSNTTFEGSLHIDETLFSEMAERELHFRGRRKWLDELMPRVQKRSLARINRLVKWFEQADGASSIAKFYRDLAGAGLQENQALMQLGWGTGWDGCTFDTYLKKDAALFEQLVREFKMQKTTRGAAGYRQGDEFPRSRRAVMSVKEGVSVARAPLGWVLVELDKTH